MKKNRSKKNKPNMSIAKNTYCIALGNAGKRTAGVKGLIMEGPQRNVRPYLMSYDRWSEMVEYYNKNPYYIS